MHAVVFGTFRTRQQLLLAPPKTDRVAMTWTSTLTTPQQFAPRFPPRPRLLKLTLHGPHFLLRWRGQRLQGRHD